MVRKKKTPYAFFALVFVFFEILGYLISGLYRIPNVSILTLEESLIHIVTHPFQNWWNERTPLWLEVAGASWIMFVGWYQYNYRNFQFGIEDGSENWGDVRQVSKELAGNNSNNMRILSEHVRVSKDEDVLSNNNIIVVASSGRYKTTSIVETNIAEKNASVVMLDVKGASLRKLGNYMLDGGDYVVRCLNLKEPWLSDRYNPFRYVKREYDLIRLVTNLQASVRKPEQYGGDPFWDDGVKLYLMSMFFDEWLTAEREKRYGSMNNILRLVNMESKKIVIEIPQGKKVLKIEKTALQIRMEELEAQYGDDYPPVRYYKELKEGASETVRSIIIMVNAMLCLCETADIRRIFSGDDINIPEIGLGVNENPNKKVFLALVLPDNDTSFNFVINMFYTQLFDVLIDIADNKIHGPLPIPVEVWADEFYAGPKPRDPEALMGVIRSRNICLNPILQSVAQAEALLKDGKWKIMMDNAAVFAFYGAAPGGKDTHEFISNLLGDMTIDTRKDGEHTGKSGSGNKDYGTKARKLMTPGEVKRMKRDECILFIECEYPVLDTKYLPWKHKESFYRKAKKLGPYVHPVRTVYNKEKMEYRTIEPTRMLQEISAEEAEFFRQASKNDNSIHVYDIDEKDFLYLNWHVEPRPTEDELVALIKDIEEKEENGEVPEDVLQTESEKEKNEDVPKFGTQEGGKWNLSGNIFECLKRYANSLTDGQINEIISGMEQGLADKQIKSYFNLPEEKMRQYRRAFVFKNRAAQTGS